MQSAPAATSTIKTRRSCSATTRAHFWDAWRTTKTWAPLSSSSHQTPPRISLVRMSRWTPVTLPSDRQLEMQVTQPHPNPNSPAARLFGNRLLLAAALILGVVLLFALVWWGGVG